MHAIQCYAPTNESDEDVKEEIYHRLQSIIQAHPKRIIIIVMGDFNAKIQMQTTLLLARVYSITEVIHKATWVSPDSMTENQIDHVCIGKKFRRSLQDVCVEEEQMLLRITIF